MPTKFRVSFLPISVNRIYSYNHYNKTMYLTEEARHFKMALKIACPKIEFKSEQPKLRVEVWYHSPTWICKNGKFRKRDSANMDKLVHDAITERLGRDDSHIWMHSGEKVVDIDEFTEIVISEIEGA